MKTNLFIAALSLVVLASCSGEDEIGTLVAKNDNAINFGTYVGKQTKATEKSSFETGDTFGVLGYYALAYIIHSGFISGYQNRYGDNLKPPTNVYHRMTA